jgi:uroporphyrinogen decarboxylase
MPEYRALRQKHSILELCHHPELAVQVTLQPVERLGVDAAILFADILLPFEPLGLGLAFNAGEGPSIARPIREAAHVARLPEIDPEQDLGYVLDAVRLLAKTLPPHVPLIGFAGAPFTLASYAIEGGSTRTFITTKRFRHAEPAAWHALMERFAGLVGRYLAAQARAGARALQLFDSWVGCLAPEDYRTYVQPYSRRALELAGAAGVPVIHFGTDTAGLLEDFAAAGGDVIGVDWRVPLDWAWERIGPARAIQGNLDPATLLAPAATLEARVRDILRRAGGRPGHIFNLGHGVLPETPVEALQAVVELVHGC